MHEVGSAMLGWFGRRAAVSVGAPLAFALVLLIGVQPVFAEECAPTVAGFPPGDWAAHGIYTYKVDSDDRSTVVISATGGFTVNVGDTGMARGSGGGASVTTAGPAATTAASPAAERDFVRDIDVGGRTMSIACVGPTDTGRPTVLFEAGLGGDRSGWGEAMTKLMATDRGCSYDRAGLGLSEPGPKPRTTDGQVDDLHALLGAAGIEPPYVFVGHSSGGWNVMVYAGRYPDEIAGVVFVDVRPPLASERFVAALPPASADEPEPVHQTRADLTEWEQDPTRNPEGLDLIKSAGQAAASPGFGDRPLIVLTAGDRAGVTGGLPSELAKAFDEIWMDLQTKLVGLSSKGQQQIVAGATHDLPFEKPDVVIVAIREVLSSSGS